MSENNTQLLMRRDLLELAELVLPNNIKIRTFSNGDEAAWNHIIEKSFEQKYDFNEFMRKDAAYKAENVMIAEVDGVLVATASAWHKSEFGEDTGYLHMVGCLPEYKGIKLGYLVSLKAMIRLKDIGYTKVVLHTDDFRLPAIKTYLNLGFKIDLSLNESINERWNKIMEKLSL